MSNAKKKLFIPRKIDERLVDWNNMQPIIDGEKINQYDLNTGNPTGRWGQGDKYMGDTTDLFETLYDVFADDLIDEDLGKDYVYDSLINSIKNDLYETLSEEGPLSPFHYDLTIPLDSEEVRKKFDKLYDVSYRQFMGEAKLFIPRNVESRYDKWNEEQLIVDGKHINQFNKSGKKEGLWIERDNSGRISSKIEWKDFIPVDINKEMGDKDKILKSFEPQKELNPKIWDEDGKLKKKIKDTLVAIGQEFHNTLEVEAPIDDIIFTGSLANYNWSQYSDVDLHVLMDFNEFDDKELIKKYFDTKKAYWNDNHDIKIKGYDVELYAQDKDEPHESTGIYSVMKDEWVKKPKPQDVKIDRETIKKKVKEFESEYNRIVLLYNEGKYKETKKALEKIKDKIKKYRKAGLDKGGEMATENLVFKTMRRSGLMGKIYKLGIKTTDKEYTIETLNENEKKKLFIPRRQSGENSKWNQWNKEQPVKDGIRINQYDEDGLKTGYWEEYWKNGNIESKGLYVNGKREGIWEKYYDNGNISSKGLFKDGKTEGIWRYYHENGNIDAKGLYKDGKEEGIWGFYWENGNLYSKGSYKDGKEEGLWEWYHPNGNIESKGLYKDGDKEGIWEWYHPNGVLMLKGLYKEGKREGIWEEYWYNGNLRSKELYKNGKLVKSLPLNESEQPKKKKLFIPRRQSGENSKWNDWNKEQPIKDGIRINQYTHDGLKTGIWEEYYNGNIEYRGSYKNGKREGIWEEYYRNGNIWSKGLYKEGKKEGIWEEYWYNGNISSKGPYKNGKEEGIWEWYYNNGNLYLKELYKNGDLIKSLPLNESEQPKKKLFIPRRQSGEDSKWNQWNKEQPVKDGIRINQYNHDGLKTGIWEEYYNGNIESKGLYKEGKKEGIWEEYYFNGNIWSKGLYKEGKKEGIWEWYYINGNIYLKGLYKEGKKEGIWEYYWFNGNLLYRSSYKNGELIKKLPLNESENISEGKIGDNINKTLKTFKKTIGVDAGFLASFGAEINGVINNINSLIREYSFKDLNDFELTNLAIALIVVYLKNKNSLKRFKNELLLITAFTSLIPGYSDLINSLVGNVDFMEAFMTIIKSVGVYTMLSHFKSK